MKSHVILLLLLPILALTACRRGDVQVQLNGDGAATVTATLSEADVNAAVTEALANMPNPLLRNPQVDLQNGVIVINGEHERRDGGGTVQGSINVTLTVQNGTILAQVSNLNIEGVEVSDERLTTFNERLVNGFNARANRENRHVTVTSVTITDSQIEFVFEVVR